MAEYCNDHFTLVEDNEDSFRMWQGLVGPYYTPIMENDGTLRWTNNGLLPNPEAVNLRGPQGAGIVLAGIVETEEELPGSANPGAIWLVGTESPYEGWSYIGGEWVDLGALTVGPAGPPGPQGGDYVLTAADKAEIAADAEDRLIGELQITPLPIGSGGTDAGTLAGAKENLGITDLEEQIGDTPLATDAQDIRGAINELVGDLGSLDFDTDAQNVTDAVNELNSDKVSKTGGTITGGLSLKTDAAEIGHTGSQIVNPIFAFKDKNDAIIGYLRGVFRSDGKNAIQFGAARGSYNNVITLEIDANGGRTVTLPSVAPWLIALGLGTSGALPITVAQGGTGQTGVSSTTTVSDIIASTGSGITILGANFCQWGKVAMFDIAVKLSTAVSTLTDTTVATLVSNKRPIYYASAVARATGANNTYIATDGAIHIVGTLSANTNIHILSTYILA